MPEEGPYTLRILRVDLTTGKVSEELIDGETTAKYVGGTGLAMKYLWEEVPAGVKWSDPENRLTFFTGPLAGTRVCGSGTFSVTTLGACTDMCGTAQANGFFGAFMRLERHRRRHRAGCRRRSGPAFTSRTASSTSSTRSTCWAMTPGRPRTRSRRRSGTVQRLQHRPGR